MHAPPLIGDQAMAQDLHKAWALFISGVAVGKTHEVAMGGAPLAVPDASAGTGAECPPHLRLLYQWGKASHHQRSSILQLQPKFNSKMHGAGVSDRDHNLCHDLR